MKKTFLRFLAISLMLGTLAVWSCDPVGNPSLPPIANLDFVVVDGSFQPLEKARIYLFPFKGTYDTYLQENPQGRGSLVPNLNPRNIGQTDSAGQFVFANYELQGNEYASGNTWVHRPDPIYYRIEATVVQGSDTLFLTNDGSDKVLAFGDLDNGTVLFEEIEVILQ